MGNAAHRYKGEQDEDKRTKRTEDRTSSEDPPRAIPRDALELGQGVPVTKRQADKLKTGDEVIIRSKGELVTIIARAEESERGRHPMFYVRRFGESEADSATLYTYLLLSMVSR